jgi:hypothetical protein
MVARGRIPDAEVLNAFTRFKHADYSIDRARCNACGNERAWHTTDLKIHLTRCKQYNKHKAKTQPSIDDKIPVVRLSSMHMRSLQLDMAMAIVMDALPLDAFEKKKHLSKIYQRFYPSVAPPTAKKIVTDLLPG